jgi:hypothetical protein
MPLLLVLLVIFASQSAWAQKTQDMGCINVPVFFSNGHQTDPQDHGRPVVLVAAGLGVPAQVFRNAFRGVRPAPAGMQPDPQQVHSNKETLLAALRPYGVTNNRLDEVSNYYRYNPSSGKLWPIRPASAYAVVKNGSVVRYVVTAGGSGYSSAPDVTIPSIPGSRAKAKLSFSTDLDNNGAVIAIDPRGEK